MAIRNDLSDLPTAPAPAAVGGLEPDAHPRFVTALTKRLQARHDEDKATAMGTRFRHSDAGKCSRYLGYVAAQVPKSDPMDLPGIWNTWLGTLIHEAWQDALADAYPTAEIEMKARIDDFDGSCHIDAIVREPCADCDEGVAVGVKGGVEFEYECGSCLGTGVTNVVSIELKSTGGYAFKGAVGRARKATPAQGPKAEHLLQAALNAHAVHADEAVVAYFAKECISNGVGADLPPVARFAAEWTFTREQFLPLALQEMERINGILNLVDHGQLPARKHPDMPKGAEIVDVRTSRWEHRDLDSTLIDTGTVWSGQLCSYCSYRTLCDQAGPGRIPVEQAVEISRKAA